MTKMRPPESRECSFAGRGSWTRWPDGVGGSPGPWEVAGGHLMAGSRGHSGPLQPNVGPPGHWNGRSPRGGHAHDGRRERAKPRARGRPSSSSRSPSRSSDGAGRPGAAFGGPLSQNYRPANHAKVRMRRRGRALAEMGGRAEDHPLGTPYAGR